MFQLKNMKLTFEQKQGLKGSYWVSNIIKSFKGKDGTMKDFSMSVSMEELNVIYWLIVKAKLGGIKDLAGAPTQPVKQYAPKQVVQEMDTDFMNGDSSEVPF